MATTPVTWLLAHVFRVDRRCEREPLRAGCSRKHAQSARHDRERLSEAAGARAPLDRRDIGRPTRRSPRVTSSWRSRRRGSISRESRRTRSSPSATWRVLSVPPRLFVLTPSDLRRELAADLSRGGYVLTAEVGEHPGASRYFDKYLVLSRPGLLARSASSPQRARYQAVCDRIAVTGVLTGALGAALAQRSGIPLVYALDTGTPEMRFGGEAYSGLARGPARRRGLHGQSRVERCAGARDGWHRGARRRLPSRPDVRWSTPTGRGRLRSAVALHRGTAARRATRAER